MPNEYAICPGCRFGIEVSAQRAGESTVHSDYASSANNCYYCAIDKPRSAPSVKHLLAESEVLLRSAQRVNDDAATAFYAHQVARCNEALDIEETQRSLF